MIAFLSRWEKLWKVDRYDKINYIHILSRVFTILKIIILSKTIFLKSDCVDLLDRSRSIQKVSCFLFELILITPINYIDLLDRHLFFFFFFFCLFWLPTHRAEPLFLKIFFSHSTSNRPNPRAHPFWLFLSFLFKEAEWAHPVYFPESVETTLPPFFRFSLSAAIKGKTGIVSWAENRRYYRSNREIIGLLSLKQKYRRSLSMPRQSFLINRRFLFLFYIIFYFILSFIFIFFPHLYIKFYL